MVDCRNLEKKKADLVTHENTRSAPDLYCHCRCLHVAVYNYVQSFLLLSNQNRNRYWNFKLATVTRAAGKMKFSDKKDTVITFPKKSVCVIHYEKNPSRKWWKRAKHTCKVNVVIWYATWLSCHVWVHGYSQNCEREAGLNIFSSVILYMPFFLFSVNTIYDIACSWKEQSLYHFKRF